MTLEKNIEKRGRLQRTTQKAARWCIVLMCVAGSQSCGSKEDKEREVAARWAHIEEQGATPRQAPEAPREDASETESGDTTSAATSEEAANPKPDSKPQAPAAPKTPGALDGLTEEKVRASIEAAGWTVLGEPDKKVDEDGSEMTLFPIIKPPMGGVVGLCKYNNELVASGFAERMETQPGGGVARKEGGRVLTVAIPKNKDKAVTLLEKIISDAKR